MSSAPPDSSSPATEATPRPARRWGSLAGGCALGCLGLIILVVVSVIGLVRWGTRSSLVPGVTALLTPDAHLYLSVSVDPADPGTLALLDAFTAARNGQDDLQLRDAAPIRFTGLALGDGPSFVGALSVSRYMNWLRLSFLPAYYFGDTQVTHYRQSRLLVGGGHPVAVTISGGSLIVASDADVARYAVDRLEDGDGGRSASDLEAFWLESVGAPVRLAAANRDGSLVKILDQVLAYTDHGLGAESALPDLLGRSRGLSLTANVGVSSATQIKGAVVLHVPNATDVELESLRGAIPWLEETLKGDVTRFAAEARRDGDSLVLEFLFDLNLAQIGKGKWGGRVGPVKVEGW